MSYQLYCDNELIAEFVEQFTAEFCQQKLSRAFKDQAFEVREKPKTGFDY